MKLHTLSDVFADTAKRVAPDEVDHLSPKLAGAHMALSPQAAGGYYTPDGEFMNMFTGLVLWWRCKNRRVWRLKKETAEYLRSINTSFLPEESPPSWTGDAILIESPPDQPFVQDIFSLICYRVHEGVEATSDKFRYFFTYLTAPDGYHVFSIDADIFKINEKMAKNKKLLEGRFVFGEDWVGRPVSVEDQLKRLEIIRFVFVFSYFVEFRDRFDIDEKPGPPKRRGPKKKVVRVKGKPVSLWSYADASLVPREASVRATGEGAPLNTEGLALTPTIVGPHIRRTRSGNVKLIEQYDSHRWRNPEKIGQKTKI